MNIALEDISTCSKRLKVEIPSNTVNEEIDRVTSEFQKQATLKGFRAGKAPKSIIEKRYSNDIDEEVKRKLVPKAFRQAIREKKLKVVSQPAIEDLNYQRGVSMSFSTVVELAPEFRLPEYKDLKVEKQDEAVTEEEINEVKDRIRQQYADFKDIEDRAAEEADFAVITYTGKIDDKPISEIVPSPATIGANSNFWLRLNDDHFLPGFGKQLIGSKPGETRTIEIEFPDDYLQEAVQGKKASYEVKVESLKEQILPPLDEELSQKVAQISLEEMEKNIKNNLEQTKSSKARQDHMNQIIKHLSDSVNFDLPESVVKSEAQRMVNSIVQENQARGIGDETIEEKKDEIFKNANLNAKEQVKLNFILDEIAEKEKIQVDQTEMLTEVQYLAADAQITPQEAFKRLQQNQALPGLELQIKRRKVIDFLLKNANLS